MKQTDPLSEGEQLREALLELQLLRDREAKVLAETKALLSCIEQVSHAPSPEEALCSIFASLAQMVGSDLSLVVEVIGEKSYRVAAADHPGLIGQTFCAPIDLALHDRNVTNMHLLGAWSGGLALDPFAGLLVAPSRAADARQHLLMCLKTAPSGFRKGDIKLASRLSGLAVQSLHTAAMSAEHRLLAAAIEGSAAGFAIADARAADRPLIYVNAAFEHITGFAKEEVLGRNCRLLSAEAPDSPERLRLRATVSQNGRGQFLLRNRRKSGELFWTDLTLFPVDDVDGTPLYLVATQTDASDRISAEEDRNRIRARLEQSLAVTDDGFILLEADGTVAFANAAFGRFFPAPHSEWSVGTRFEDCWAEYLAGMTPSQVKDLSHLAPARLVQLRAGTEVTLPNGLTLLLLAKHLSDGATVLTATNVTAMRAAQSLLEQRLAAIEAAMDGIAILDDTDRLVYLNPAASALLGFCSADQALGRNWTEFYDTPSKPLVRREFQRSLTPLGMPTGRVHEITGSPLEPRGYILTIRDATQRLAAEAQERDLRSALARSQRQETLAQLSAGLAHDFNNLLTAINGSATLISADATTPSAVRVHAERIGNAGRRAGRLVNRLLDIGGAPTVRKTFEVNLALADLPELVGSSLPGDVRLALDRSTDVLVVRGDPGDLTRIVMNLVLNAADAISGGRGRITVRTGLVCPQADAALDCGALQAGQGYVRVDVQDTGCGMDAQTRAKALEPYFTTKGAMGTGIGLAAVAQHAVAVGGGVRLQSACGKGTTVSVYWPLAEGAGDAAQTHVQGAGQGLSGLTLLLVDDEPDVAEVMQRNLEALGAEVATCNDPQDALEAIKEDPQAWSALLTDFDMPGMNGGALIENVAQVTPALPVVVITALARRLPAPLSGPDQTVRVLSKPVDLTELRDAILCATQTEQRP